ncbi:MAG: hypothetical protein ACI4WH_07975 [Oscillospiraceae bacterium]
MSSTITQLEVVSTSTCVDFFSKLKDTILDNTNFELLEESIAPDSLYLTFDTKIYDFKLKIATKETSSTAANVLLCTLSNDSRAVSSIINVGYTASAKKSTEDNSRKVNLFIHECDKSYLVKIGGYNDITWNYNFNVMVLGKLSSKTVADGTEHIKILYCNTLYDAQGDTDNIYFTKVYNANPCVGVVKQNLLLTNTVNNSVGVTGTIKEYCTNLYCCSTLTSGFRYKINGKTYFAFDPNILIEE